MIVQQILFTKEECKSILNLVTNWKTPKVNVGGTESTYNLSERNSLESNIIDTTSLNDIVLNKLSKFDIISLPTNNRIIKYTKGSYFKNHKDRSTSDSNRLLTLIIQLSDTNDYTGAELLVEGSVVSKEIGNLILFDSGLEHEVISLLSGERYVFITWITKENISQLTKTLL